MLFSTAGSDALTLKLKGMVVGGGVGAALIAIPARMPATVRRTLFDMQKSVSKRGRYLIATVTGALVAPASVNTTGTSDAESMPEGTITLT